jgi:hypothetical protein
MTRIEAGRPVVRETAVQEQRRPLIVELHPGEIALRLKGMRQRYTIGYSAVYWLAAKSAAQQARVEKKPRRRR